MGFLASELDVSGNIKSLCCITPFKCNIEDDFFSITGPINSEARLGRTDWRK